MIWLGEERGCLTDWVTQQWVRTTGRRVAFDDIDWLDGPAGRTRRIGPDFFDAFAAANGLAVLRGGDAGRGLLPSFAALAGPHFEPARVHPDVAAFYERTSGYDLDAWAEWSGAFRPFGRLLALLFSRRLQQLNVPISALDTSRGMTSEVLQLVDPASGAVRHTAWVRSLVGTGNVVYAGSYSICRVPGFDGPCVRVVFPLPNGNAVVVMRPHAHEDGSFSIVSAGAGFGAPGFYFTVRRPARAGRGGAEPRDGASGGTGARGDGWARYVKTMRETIRVYRADDGGVRADHVLRIWGTTFLRLHYRLRVRPAAAVPAPA